MSTKRCPDCGSDIFVAKIIRGAAVKSMEDGSFSILKEVAEHYEIELVKCNKCKRELTKADLIETVLCTKCGLPTIPSTVNDKGVCDVCQALETRDDLAGASREDLLRKVLMLERLVPTANSMSINSKIDKANAVEEKLLQSAPVTVDNSTDPTPAPDVNTEAPSNTDPQPPVDSTEGAEEPVASTRKRRVRKAGTEEPSEGVTVATPSVADMVSELDQLSEGQAPFPETSNDLGFMNLPNTGTETPTDKPAYNPDPSAPQFTMFDEKEPEF